MPLLKPSWLSYIHSIRTLELTAIHNYLNNKRDGLFLEIGSGDGFQSHLLTTYSRHFIASDYHAAFFKERDIPFVACDAQTIRNLFCKAKFDCIYSSNLLEHCRHPEVVLAGIAQLLSDDGLTIHAVPNRFWKLCQIVLYVPSRCVVLVETLLKPQGWRIVYNQLLDLYRELSRKGVLPESFDRNNPAIFRKKRSALYRMIVPVPHGISQSHRAEFMAFSKKRWKKMFVDAGFTQITIIAGPASSGYGLGLNRIRRFLHWCNIGTEYFYIAQKK